MQSVSVDKADAAGIKAGMMRDVEITHTHANSLAGRLVGDSDEVAAQ